jgi:hypothetical protein
MGLFTRLSNGWEIAMNSFKVLKANRQLIVFPILAGISLLLIIGSFAATILAASGWDVDNIAKPSTAGSYALLIGFYIVNYFVMVFFNVALTHCAALYFKGEEVSISKGIQFSVSRIGAIFSWAVFAGTIGAVLKVIQENSGTIGKILTGIIGIVWSVATFFVVPVIAYENLDPLAAFKRSSQLMKQKWGETIGSGFSFGLIQLAGLAIVLLPAFIIGKYINPIAGIAFGILGVMTVLAIISAARTVFISAVYHNVTGDPVEHFNQNFIDTLFVKK